jgi:hypothetical protein
LASLLACAAVPAAILTGCGGGGGSADVGPAADAPANAALYVDATVRPTGSAQSDAKAALSKILSTHDPGAKIVSFIEDQSKADGHPISYQQDIAPWLGEKAGAFFTKLGNTTQQGAVVVETTNPGAAFAFARKASGATATNPAPQTYNGVPYQTDPSSKGPDQTVFGTVGNFLVEGDLAGFQAAVNASKGDSLGDSSDFKDAIGNLPDDRLGTLYTVPRNFIAALGPQQFGASQQQLLEKTAGDSLNQPVAGAVTASADNIQIDAVGGSGVDTPQSSLIGDVPSQAWLAVGLADLGDNIKKSLDQLKSAVPNLDQALSQVQSSTGSSIGQLTSALGDAVLYVQGTTQSTLTGALVVQTKNPELTGRLLGQLQSLLALGSRGGVKQLQLSGGGTGFEIDDPSVAPRPVEIAQQGDKLVISYGAGSAEQTLTPASKLSGSPSFSSAEGQISSLGADFFLDLPSVFALAESTGSKSDPQYVQAKPYLDALSYLVTGSGSKGDQAELKAVVGLR